MRSALAPSKWGTFAGPKKCVRHRKVSAIDSCPLDRGFSIRLDPNSSSCEKEKVSAIIRCPLYRLSAIDSFYCNSYWSNSARVGLKCVKAHDGGKYSL